jgi:hypothetical protein
MAMERYYLVECANGRYLVRADSPEVARQVCGEIDTRCEISIASSPGTDLGPDRIVGQRLKSE